MEHAIVVLEVELGKLREENLINQNMINTFKKENVEPCKRTLERTLDVRSKIQSIESALTILRQNI